MTGRERWLSNLSKHGVNPKIDAFIEEIISVCKKHGMSISHEDGHGGFEIEEYDDDLSDWLRNASDEITKEEKND